MVDNREPFEEETVTKKGRSEVLETIESKLNGW